MPLCVQIWGRRVLTRSFSRTKKVKQMLGPEGESSLGDCREVCANVTERQCVCSVCVWKHRYCVFMKKSAVPVWEPCNMCVWQNAWFVRDQVCYVWERVAYVWVCIVCVLSEKVHGSVYYVYVWKYVMGMWEKERHVCDEIVCTHMCLESDRVQAYIGGRGFHKLILIILRRM